MESWYTDYCPRCSKLNWVNNGDETDLTVSDIDGIRCWGCKHVWYLDADRGEEWYKDIYGDGEGLIEDGRHFEEVKE